MSYCRWSTDDFRCDVYCYEHDCGYAIHVAGNRVIWGDLLPPDVDYNDTTAWVNRMVEVMRIVQTLKRERIGLPYDGISYDDETPGEAADRLQMLKDAGYIVPQFAIDNLREESKTES